MGYDNLPSWFLGFDIYHRESRQFLSCSRRNNLFQGKNIRHCSSWIFYMKLSTAEPPAGDRTGPFGPARSDPKAISPFALPGVKKRRLFEDKPDRSSCALDRQGKRAADGPGPIRSPVGGGFMPFGSASTTHASLCPPGHVGL